MIWNKIKNNIASFFKSNYFYIKTISSYQSPYIQIGDFTYGNPKKLSWQEENYLNIRHYSIIKSIVLDDDFQYAERDILYKTHLRFFCKKNIIELFTSADLIIEFLTSGFEQKPIKSKTYWPNKITLGFLYDFFIYQYLIVATKKG